MVGEAWLFDYTHNWVEGRSRCAPVNESRGSVFAMSEGLAQ